MKDLNFKLKDCTLIEIVDNSCAFVDDYDTVYMTDLTFKFRLRDGQLIDESWWSGNYDGYVIQMH